MSGADERMEFGTSMNAEGPTEVKAAANPEQTMDKTIQAEKQIEALEKQIEVMQQKMDAMEKKNRAMDAMAVVETAGGIEAGATEVPLWKLFATRLPTELRIKVHEYVLGVGKIYPERFHWQLPNDKDGNEYHGPNMRWLAALALIDNQLMMEGIRLERPDDHGGVVRTYLKSEAEEVVYGKNTIVLERDSYQRFLLSKYTESSQEAWPRNRYIRSIHVIVWNALDEMHYQEIVDSLESDKPLSPQERLDFIHAETLNMSLNFILKQAFELVDRLPRLKRLKVDLRYAYCPIGCCRLAKELVREKLRFEEKESLEEVVLLGAVDDEEKETLGEIMRTQVRGPVDGKSVVRVVVKHWREEDSEDW